VWLWLYGRLPIHLIAGQDIRRCHHTASGRSLMLPERRVVAATSLDCFRVSLRCKRTIFGGEPWSRLRSRQRSELPWSSGGRASGLPVEIMVPSSQTRCWQRERWGSVPFEDLIQLARRFLVLIDAEERREVVEVPEYAKLF
jgi:hypothetical protein